MARAGILGNLEYKDDQPEWGLILGLLSGRYEVIAQAVPNQQLPVLHEWHRDTVREMNNILKDNRVSYTVPELVPGVAPEYSRI